MIFDPTQVANPAVAVLAVAGVFIIVILIGQVFK